MAVARVTRPSYPDRRYRSVTRLVVLRPPWVTRSVIRAPFRRFRFLRAAAVSRSLTVTVPARFAVADPVATTTGLPFGPGPSPARSRRS